MGVGWQDQWWEYPTGCGSVGDDGEFQAYSSGKTIDLAGGVIACDGSGAQCPADEGWACSAGEADEIGTCQAPPGYEGEVACPALGGEWAEIGELDPNPDLAFQTGCLTVLGTGGCGWEQPLAASVRGLSRPDQSGFVRQFSLLAALFISDEDDCSVADWQGILSSEEVQNLVDGKINLACGNHPEHLYTAQHYYDALVELKGKKNAVAFAAIVGVPPDEQCQGSGYEIADCLDHPDMQLEEVQEGSQQAWFFKPACERYAGEELVTKARPGRRFVELAQSFEHMGNVYSICNEDWSPIVEDFAMLIADNMCGGGCFPKPLPWDPTTHTSTCDLWVEYRDVLACPAGLEEATTWTFTDNDGVEHMLRHCELPKVAAPLECAAAEQSGACSVGLGWYYCENMTSENFNEACDDTIDNDADGYLNCDDPDCTPCTVCGGSGFGCEKTCKYDVRLSDQAKQLVWGQRLGIVCQQQFSSTDSNCQESTNAVCNDGEDNDGNGIWDCSAVHQGDNRHGADFNCCPMHVDQDNQCVVEPEAFDICQMTPFEPSDACRAHAQLLQCIPPWYV
jgi:hypothetical protein